MESDHQGKELNYVLLCQYKKRSKDLQCVIGSPRKSSLTSVLIFKGTTKETEESLLS